MHKTSGYRSADETVRRATLAAREGTTQAEVIRRVIRLYEPTRRGDRSFSLSGSADGPGGTVADLSETELLEGFGT
ncbi:MAG TPA: hypothetical protein VNF24_04400 [Candidatus Acidoferrales bacterium]|nr:hypothetical protein [Candidatus Acidoferrales bacterium]